MERLGELEVPGPVKKLRARCRRTFRIPLGLYEKVYETLGHGSLCEHFCEDPHVKGNTASCPWWTGEKRPWIDGFTEPLEARSRADASGPLLRPTDRDYVDLI